MGTTEESTTRDALRESEEALATAESVANIGDWRYECESGARRWSDQMFRILGLEPGSEPPSPALYRSLVHEGDRDRLDDFHEAGKADLGSTVSIEHRLVQRNGSVRRVKVTARPWEREGRIVGRIGVVHDITEQLRTTELVLASEARLATLFETVHSGLVLVGPDGLPILVNQAYCDLVGRIREEVLGRPFEPYLHPVDRATAQERFSSRLAGEQGDESRTRRLVRPDGQVLFVEMSSSSFSMDGEVVGSLVEIYDVTAERALAEDRRGQHPEGGAREAESPNHIDLVRPAATG